MIITLFESKVDVKCKYLLNGENIKGMFLEIYYLLLSNLEI